MLNIDQYAYKGDKTVEEAAGFTDVYSQGRVQRMVKTGLNALQMLGSDIRIPSVAGVAMDCLGKKLVLKYLSS